VSATSLSDITDTYVVETSRCLSAADIHCITACTLIILRHSPVASCCRGGMISDSLSSAAVAAKQHDIHERNGNLSDYELI
jgi:hypothetical protein